MPNDEKSGIQMENAGTVSFSPGDRMMLDLVDSFRGLRCKELWKKRKGEITEASSVDVQRFPSAYVAHFGC